MALSPLVALQEVAKAHSAMVRVVAEAEKELQQHAVATPAVKSVLRKRRRALLLLLGQERTALRAFASAHGMNPNVFHEEAGDVAWERGAVVEESMERRSESPIKHLAAPSTDIMDVKLLEGVRDNLVVQLAR